MVHVCRVLVIWFDLRTEFTVSSGECRLYFSSSCTQFILWQEQDSSWFCKVSERKCVMLWDLESQMAWKRLGLERLLKEDLVWWAIKGEGDRGGPRGRVRGSRKRLRPVRPGFLLTQCSVFILCFLFPKELYHKFYSFYIYLKFFTLFLFYRLYKQSIYDFMKYKYIIHMCLYSLHI